MSARHARQGRRRGALPIGLGLGLAILAPLAATASGAHWVDDEYAHGEVGTIDCAAGGYRSAATSRLLGGSFLGQDLDSVASLTAAVATNDGTEEPQVVSDPLDEASLGGINADLGGGIALDLGAEAGALHQYAVATASGWSLAATGAVTDVGAIALGPVGPGDEPPAFATMSLSTVLDTLSSGAGTGISGLTDAALVVGALASVAELDGCAADWSDDTWGALERDYAIAGLGAELSSPLVGDVLSTLESGLPEVEGLVEAVAGDSGLVSAIGDATVSALASILADFLVGTPVVSLALDVDLSAVVDAVGTAVADPDGIAVVDLAAGKVTVDLARLLGPAYEDSVGLNGLAPNTELLLNASAAAALLGAVDDAAGAWAAGVSSAIEAAVDAAHVDLEVEVPISVVVAPIPILLPSGITVPVGSVVVSATDASLASLVAGTAPIDVSTVLTPPSCSGLVGAAICDVVNPLLTGLTSAASALVLDTVLGPVVGGLIGDLLDPVPGLNSLLNDLGIDLGAVLDLLSASLQGLFGADAVLSIVVNAQNAPDPVDLSAPPGDEPGWLDLDVPETDPFGTGEFAVAALRLVTLGVVSNGVAVDLARSSVGSNGR